MNSISLNFKSVLYHDLLEDKQKVEFVKEKMKKMHVGTKVGIHGGVTSFFSLLR
jgi:hypothetical protein